MASIWPVVAVFLLHCYLGDAEDNLEVLAGLRSNVRLYKSINMTEYDVIMNETDKEMVLGVDYHLEKNLVFISTTNNFYRGQLKPADPSSLKSLRNCDYNKCGAFAVDWVHDKIYYFIYNAENASALNEMDLDGSNVANILNITDSRYFRVRRLRVDPYQGILFWGRLHDVYGILESCDTSGANHRTKIDGMIHFGRPIFLDLEAKRIYYTLFHEMRPENNKDSWHSLHSFDYNGGNRESPVTREEMGYITNLYVYKGNVYWINYIHHHHVYKAPLHKVNTFDAGPVQRLKLFVGRDMLMDFALVHPDFQKRP